jgi:hypothetical protein
MGTSLYEQFQREKQEPKPTSLYEQYLREKQASAAGRPSSGSSRSWGPETVADVAREKMTRPFSGGPGLNDLARSGLQGLTVGFGDEITAGANALLGHDIQETLADERAGLARTRAEHPKTAFAVEAAASLVPAMIPGVREMGLVRGGALFGAAYGAGASDKDRLAGAAQGGILGAGGAGALKALAPVGRVGYDLARFGAKKAGETKAGQATASTVSKIISQLVENPVGLTTKNVGPNMVPGSTSAPNATRATAPRIPDAVRDVLPRSPKDRAANLVLSRLGQDKQTPQTVLDAIQSSAKPLAAADVAGENTLALQRWTRSVPSSARDDIPGALYDRQAGMQERIVSDITELAGVSRKNIPEAIQSRAAAREAEAGPLFDRLRELPPADPKAMLGYLSRPSFQRALKQAEAAAAETGRPFPPIIDDAGNIRPLDFETVQNIKLALDDVLEKAPRDPLESGGMGKNRDRLVRQAKNEFLELADQMFSGYKEARDVFAGHSAIMNAMNDGRKFFAMPTDEAALALRGMSASEKEAFIEGAVNAVADKIERGLKSHNAAQRVVLPTDMQKRLRLLFPDEQSFEAFIDRAQKEATMNRSLQQTVGGSQTFEKMQEGAANDDAAVQMGLDVIQGRVTSLADRVKNSALLARARGLNQETANELGPIFTAGMRGDKDEARKVMRWLIEAEQRELQRQMRRNAASRPITGAIGSYGANQR